MAADRSVLDRRPTLGISWRLGTPVISGETGFMDTLDPRTRKRMPNPSVELPADAPAADDPGALCRHQWRIAGPVPDPLRSGSRA
jgi:hypothetical protein